MPKAKWIVLFDSAHDADMPLSCDFLIFAITMLYQYPTLTNSIDASSAANANHPTACCPYGITIKAANRGPMELPPLPPT